MGYTHYWTFKLSNIRHPAWDKAIDDCLAICRVARQDGYDLDVHLDTKRLSINGRGPNDGHEDFFMPVNKAAIRNYIAERKAAGDFCKTAQKAYDVVVTACLAVLAEHGLAVDSDGEAHEWEPGIYLAEKALGRKVKNPIPPSDPLGDFNYVGSRHHY
jgi:hypothetical protein